MALPLDRNYYNEGTQSSYDLQRLGQGIFDNYGQYSGNLGQTDLTNFAGMLGQIGTNNSTLTGFANDQTRQSNAALRQGNLADVQAMAPAYQQSYRAANSELFGGLNRLDNAAGNMGANSYQQSLGNTFNAGPIPAGQMGVNSYQQGVGDIFNAGTSALGRGLETSALQQLNMGTSTSPEEQRAATQQARAGMSARGLGASNGAIAAEVLNNYQLGQQRLQQRQGFAQNAFGQQQSDRAGLASIGSNLAGMDYGRQETNFNQQLASQAQNQALGTNLANMDYGRQGQNFGQQATAASLRAGTTYDPNQMILAQNSQNAGLNQGLFGNASGFSSGAYGNQNAQQLTNPFNPYSADVYNSNYNAANARYIADGNNAAAMAGARDANTGQLANSFLNLLGQYMGGRG